MHTSAQRKICGRVAFGSQVNFSALNATHPVNVVMICLLCDTAAWDNDNKYNPTIAKCVGKILLPGSANGGENEILRHSSWGISPDTQTATHHCPRAAIFRASQAAAISTQSCSANAPFATLLPRLGRYQRALVFYAIGE